MRLFRKAPTTNIKTQSREPRPSPTRPRLRSPLSKSFTITVDPVEERGREKRPYSTIMPRDSGTSLTSSPSPTGPRRRQRGSGPYCPKRPNLKEILANDSCEPWTLEAFRTYCEQNLCSENLSFIEEADRYAQLHKQWSAASAKLPADSLKTLTDDLSKRWRYILSDYIESGGSKELNVESSVRHSMLSVSEADYPPKPEQLERAVAHTKRLIEDSILFQFLSEVQPEQHSSDEFLDPVVERDIHPHKAHSLGFIPQTSGSRPPSRDNPPHAASFSSAFKTSRMMHSPIETPRSRPFDSNAQSRPKSMFTTSKEHSHSSSSGSGDSPIIDSVILEDSTSAIASPVTSNTTASPPMSPPPGDRPPIRERSDSGWKKIGSRLGFRRKGSNNQMRRPYSSVIEETTSHPRGNTSSAQRPYSTAILDDSTSKKHSRP